MGVSTKVSPTSRQMKTQILFQQQGTVTRLCSTPIWRGSGAKPLILSTLVTMKPSWGSLAIAMVAGLRIVAGMILREVCVEGADVGYNLD